MSKDNVVNIADLKPHERLAKDIDRAINRAIDDSTPDQKYANPDVIEAILASTFWSGQKGKGMMLDITGDNIIQFLEKDVMTQCQMIHGAFYNSGALDKRLKSDALEIGVMIKREIGRTPAKLLLDHIKSRNHRDTMTVATDMFIEQSKMEIKQDVVAVKFRHIPYETMLLSTEIDQAIIADYKNHFTRLDVFIDFIVQSRFASDRKYSYLWIKADSDWGKGFLMSAISSPGYNPGAIIGLSAKEVEKMFEGGPVGKSLADFKRSPILSFDEFKTVKSEFKQIENTIQISPKSQLQFIAEVFAKLFTSAEGVPSLVGDAGVEDQFANRFSLFEEKGMLSSRPLFIERGKAAYMKSVQTYLCNQLNIRVDKMIAMGRSASADHGNRWLEGFIKDHGIANYAERLSESMPGIADNFLAWLYGEDKKTWVKVHDNILVDKKNNNYYLKSPKAALEEYIRLPGKFNSSEQVMMNKKYESIFTLIAIDGVPDSKTRRVPGYESTHKSIKLRPWIISPKIST
jgi:hypothetical protein